MPRVSRASGVEDGLRKGSSTSMYGVQVSEIGNGVDLLCLLHSGGAWFWTGHYIRQHRLAYSKVCLLFFYRYAQTRKVIEVCGIGVFYLSNIEMDLKSILPTVGVQKRTAVSLSFVNKYMETLEHACAKTRPTLDLLFIAHIIAETSSS